jgi:hypothetical protein
MEHRRNEIDREKPKYSEKNLSQCHFVHHKYHMDSYYYFEIVNKFLGSGIDVSIVTRLRAGRLSNLSIPGRVTRIISFPSCPDRVWSLH